MTDRRSAVASARGLRKEFPGQVALHGLDLDIVGGQVHALVGGNGSGKSTFIKMLAGYYPVNGGSLTVAGHDETTLTPARAYELGLRFVHQSPTVFPGLTVAENIAIASRFVSSSPWRTRPMNEMENARAALEAIGSDIDPATRVDELSPVGRTMVAVASVLQHPEGAPAPRVLVLDEPTAALPEHEVNVIFQLVRSVALRGIGVLYVSHRLPEVLELADVVTVLRDGKRTHHGSMAGMTNDQLVEHIVGGRILQGQPPTEAHHNVPDVLTITGLTTTRLHDVTLAVGGGEIVGVAGLLGSGRSELLRVLAGAQRPLSGSWRLDGRTVEPGSVRKAIASGIVHVPEDRRGHAVFPTLDARTNVLIADLTPFVGPWGVRRKPERHAARQLMKQHNVLPLDENKSLGTFSGGNQQKAVLARWLRLNPRILLLDEPTQAVDVRAKHQIHDAIRTHARTGGGTIIVSSDFAELAEICHRVVVLRGSCIVGELVGTSITEDTLLHLSALDRASTP